MYLKWLKALLILTWFTGVVCCFTVDIFGSLAGKTIFFSSVGLSIIIPVMMAIRQRKHYLRYINLIVPIWAGIICFSGNFLQKTLFVNQRTSTYHFQQERKAFIKQNETYIIAEGKRIEALIAADTLNTQQETAFINTQDNSNLPKDTIVQLLDRRTATSRSVRQVSLDFVTHSFNFDKTKGYILQGFTVKNGRITQLSLYNPQFKESPYFYNYPIYFYPNGDFNLHYFATEIVDFGSHYYLKYCQASNYLFEGKWVFQVEGKCFG